MITQNDRINVENLVDLVDRTARAYENLGRFIKAPDNGESTLYKSIPTKELIPVLEDALHHQKTLRSINPTKLWNYFRNTLDNRLNTLIIDGNTDIEEISEKVKLEIPQTVKNGIVNYIDDMFKQINEPLAGYVPSTSTGSALAGNVVALNELCNEFKKETNLYKGIILLRNIVIETGNVQKHLGHYESCASELGPDQIQKLIDYAKGQDTVSYSVKRYPNKSGYDRKEIFLPEAEPVSAPIKKGYMAKIFAKS